jgi:hypothetical protein
MGGKPWMLKVILELKKYDELIKQLKEIEK